MVTPDVCFVESVGRVTASISTPLHRAYSGGLEGAHPPPEPQGSGVPVVASPGPCGLTCRVFLLASRGPPAIPLLMPCQLGVGQGGMYLVHASPGDSI